MQKIFKNKISESTYKKYIAGALFRKTLPEIGKADTNKIFKNSLRIEKNSCAENIYNTIGLQ